ncbi:MAG: sialate O-acetylesterase [Phycisphaera sp.]|nr:sialate O-acetylesterase [Phycisphaera sp.]
MHRQISRIVWALAVMALGVGVGPAGAADGTYKVFIYAGQSNAQGKAHIDTAKVQAAMPELAELYKGRFKDGDFVVRDDVFYRYGSQGPEGSFGPLKIGMGSYRFGADFEFSSMMGDHFNEPVVISKTAYGGNALCQTFRPPSSGLPSEAALAEELAKARDKITKQNAQRKQNTPLPTMEDIKGRYGMLYRQILADYKEVTENVSKYFPQLAGMKPELAGIVWFQGWNDQYGGQDEYKSNMENLIRDLRKDLNAPKLPFVIVAMGQNGSTPAAGAMQTIQEAQMSMNDVPDFKGNVLAFRSDVLVDKIAEKYGTEKDRAARERDKEAAKTYMADGGYHYYGSPIWYTRIGKAAGEAMLGLLKNQGK